MQPSQRRSSLRFLPPTRMRTQALRAVICGRYLLASGAAVAIAQTAGRLAGTIRDPTGHVLPGVTVTATTFHFIV